MATLEVWEAEDQLQISPNSTRNTSHLVADLTFELLKILVLYPGWCCGADPERPAKALCQSTEH